MTESAVVIPESDLRKALTALVKASEPAIELFNKELAEWNYESPARMARRLQRQRDELVMAVVDARCVLEGNK